MPKPSCTRARITALIVTLAALLMVGCRREVVIPPYETPTPIPESVQFSEGSPMHGGGPRTTLQPAPTALPGTPTATPTRVPPETTATEYMVRAGDTLLRIAALYGTTVESLMRLNGLASADQLQAGQTLQVSMDADYMGPGEVLIPDSELVYGPGYKDFDIAAEVARHPGLLSQYSEAVNGQELTGAQIVTLIAEQYSVGPRVLLALLEQRGGWLSNPDPPPEARLYPMGYQLGAYWDGLYPQLSQAANALNTGFYGWWLDTLWLVQPANGSFIQYSTDLNAGTAGVQKLLADTTADYETWLADLDRFREVYQTLYGDPFAHAVEPLIPVGATVPDLVLPWAEAETWYYTGGPHPGWGTQGAFSAVDFVTDERNIGCAPSQRWVTAAAPGLVVMSEDGMVLQDLDADGFAGTGWVLIYMHMATQGRVSENTHLQVGDPVGHPSCEGGVSDASHLHFARRLNGVWIATDDPGLPMTLSGWLPISGENAYDGTLSRDGQILTACECWDAINAVRH